MYLQLKFGGKKVPQSGTAVATRAPEPEPAPAAAAVGKPNAPTVPSGGAPRIKTYLAESVPEAMTLARREMGEEAILIQSKRRETVDASKRFEVTFGVVHDAPPPVRAVNKQKEAETAAAQADVAREIGSLRRELAAIQAMLRQASFGKPLGPQDNAPAAEAYSVLLSNDVDEDLALELVSGIEADSEASAEAVRAQLALRIRTDTSVAERGKAVVLMGPPASGKTTALIKLAVEYGLKQGNPIEVFSLCKEKPRVDRTLEAMTAILGVPCKALPNAAALERELESPRIEGTLLLVDTNGYGTGTSDEEMELAAVLASGERADVHLVLPAAWHRVSIRQTVDSFEIFQPARLLFTMVDQAAVYGPLVQEAWRTKKPLSFIGSGKIGETALRPADLAWLVSRLYGVARETCGERN